MSPPNQRPAIATLLLVGLLALTAPVTAQSVVPASPSANPSDPIVPGSPAVSASPSAPAFGSPPAVLVWHASPSSPTPRRARTTR
jgi:hypothetical protein